MLQNYKKHRESGFTIIEVLIVLAIAGLIMVVVFLAVPALNRNSTNQGLKTEANNVVASYIELSNNKGGGGGLAASTQATAGSDAAKVLSSAGTKSVTKVSIIATTTTAQTPSKGDQVIIVLGSICTSQDSNVPAAGTSRQIAAFYQLESASGASYQCVSS